ncbi:HEPN domain-containing protein [Mariniflexile sp.]|uniref:HEPN domain-containing protein n=1 Tax=Mariniflexile sp. TaxID=1979402 RepID=UPI003567F170
MDKEPIDYFVNAAKKLNDANKELYKPKEDIVSFLVCKNSQFAIENYLRGYLLKNGVNHEKYTTINSLYEQCKKINKNFSKLNLVDFKCQSQNTDLKFCNEVSIVSKCFDVANNLDTLLRQERII